jgi:hypothetical protein
MSCLKKLLIVAPAGGRAGAVCTFLNDIEKISFDVGFNINSSLFDKFHSLKIHNEDYTLNHDTIERKNYYPKILIIPEIKNLNLMLYLFYKKNCQNQIEGFCAENEYSKKTFDKLYYTGIDYIKKFYKPNKYQYDYILTFEDTFDVKILTKIFLKVHGYSPKKTTISSFIESCNLSNVDIDCNHPASLAKLIIEKEKNLNLDDIYRKKWSADEILETQPPSQWYTEINKKIHHDNYFLVDNLKNNL